MGSLQVQLDAGALLWGFIFHPSLWNRLTFCGRQAGHQSASWAAQQGDSLLWQESLSKTWVAQLMSQIDSQPIIMARRAAQAILQITLEAGVRGAKRKESSLEEEGGGQDRQKQWTAVPLFYHSFPLTAPTTTTTTEIPLSTLWLGSWIIWEEWAIEHSNWAVFIFYLKSSEPSYHLQDKPMLLRRTNKVLCDLLLPFSLSLSTPFLNT